MNCLENILGISPVETTIPTGDKQTLLIKHPESESYQSFIEVGKGDDIYLLKVPLALKPSYFTIESNPEGAEVYLNDKLMGKTPTKLLEGRAGDEIKLIKVGYINHIDTLRLKGGERRQLTMNLIKQDEFKSNLNNPELIRIAVESGNTNIISVMIESGANLNEQYEDGETLLGLVLNEASEDNKDLVITLVKNGADINALDPKGKPLLHKSIDIYGCNKILFSLFVDNGANVNSRDFSKNDIAWRSPAYSNLEVASVGNSLLHTIAHRYGLLERKPFLTNQSGSSFNEMDDCLEIASLLVEKGAKMDATDSYEKTPMQYVQNKAEKKKWSALLLRQKLAEPCHKGDASSCVNLAAIEEKNGNAAQADKLLNKACEGGLWEDLPETWLSRKMDWDNTKSQTFFSMACKGGHVSGCVEAGRIETKSWKLRSS